MLMKFRIYVYIIKGAHTVYIYIYTYIQRRAMYLFVFPWCQLCFLWCLSSPGWRWWPDGADDSDDAAADDDNEGDDARRHMMPHDATWYHLIMYSVRMILHKNITCLQIICTTSWASLLYFISTHPWYSPRVHPWCLEDCEAKDLALLSFITELHGVLLKHGPLPLQQMGGVMGGNSWCGTPR